MTLDDARNPILHLFAAPREEVVALFCDKRGLQSEYFPFPECFNVKFNMEGDGIFVFFYDTVVKHWHRLPREAVDIPYLEAPEVRLDEPLST